jgi:hypothetical protein
MTSSFCDYCGCPTEHGAHFCDTCGTPLPELASRFWKLFATIAVVVVVVGLVVVGILLASGGGSSGSDATDAGTDVPSFDAMPSEGAEAGPENGLVGSDGADDGRPQDGGRDDGGRRQASRVRQITSMRTEPGIIRSDRDESWLGCERELAYATEEGREDAA